MAGAEGGGSAAGGGRSGPGGAALGVALVVLARAALDLLRLAGNPERYWDWEEAWPATEAWFLRHAHLWDQLATLQFKSFCGGCTVLAGLAAPTLAVGGDSLLAWKLLPIGWTAATLVATFVAVDRTAGRLGAWLALLLLAAPPPGLADVQLMAWGNHAESALLVAVAVALAARGRTFGLGLWVGLATWFTRTSVYAAVILLPWRVWALRRDPRGLAQLGGGLALGLAPLLVPMGGGDAGAYDLSVGGNLLPHGVGEAGRRLQELAWPPALASRLLVGLPAWGAVAWAWAAGIALVVVLGATARRTGPERPGRWVWGAMAAVFAVAFCVSGFEVPHVTAMTLPIHLRYHAPWFWLLLVVAAVGAAQAVAAGGVRRWIALGGLVVVGGVDVAALSHVTHRGDVSRLADTPVVVPLRFAWIAGWRFTDERLAAARSDDPRVEAWLRRMEGYRLGGRVLARERGWDDGLAAVAASPDAVEAFQQIQTGPAQGFADSAARNTLLLAHAEHAQALGRGAAWNLAFRGGGGIPRRGRAEEARRRVAAVVGELRAGLPDEAPCWTCSVAGRFAMAGCRTDDPGDTSACLTAAVAGLADADEVLYGAGAWCPRPAHPRSECAAIDAGPAFAAGLADPMAGVESPFLGPQEAGPIAPDGGRGPPR